MQREIERDIGPMPEPQRHPSEPPPLPPEALEGRQEKERDEKRFLLDVVTRLGLPSQGALEVLARYEREAIDGPETMQTVREFSGQYGLSFEEAFSEAEKKQVSVLYYTIEQTKNDESQRELATVLTRFMHESLARRSLRRLDVLKDQLTGIREAEEAKKTLREFLESMSILASQISPEQKENEPFWKEMVDRFKTITSSRKEMETQMRAVYDELIEEFRPFIEDELVAREEIRRIRSGTPVSAEHVMREIYGRTPEEIEAIKQRNRERVVAEIMEMKEEPHVTLDMIQRLHAVNNDGIIPRSEFKLREGESVISFGVRFGILPGDVREEMEQFIERVNHFIDERAVRGVSDMRYEMTAASFHNEMLDMHPLPDRNGSTSLLFLELMMARRGYEPSKQREPDYYKHLWKILDGNPLAMGIVGYEQYRIKYVPGYFEGTTTREARKQRTYQTALEMILERRRKHQAEKKKRRKAA